MNLKLIGLLLFAPIACAGDVGVDFESAQTGIYQAHSRVVEDSCTWDGLVADYPTAPWQTGVFIEQIKDVVNLPFAEPKGGIQRFELFRTEDFLRTSQLD